MHLIALLSYLEQAKPAFDMLRRAQMAQSVSVDDYGRYIELRDLIILHPG